MPNAHAVGKLYWHRIRLERDAPLYHQYPTYEYEPPFRYGTGHIFRVPKTKLGVVLGRFVSKLPEDAANYAAVQGEPHGELELADEEVQVRVRNRGWLIRGA